MLNPPEITTTLAKVGGSTPDGSIYSEESVKAMYEQMKAKGYSVYFRDGELILKVSSILKQKN